MSKDKTGSSIEAGSPAALEHEIEQARAQLADTIDLLVHRANPKTIASRQVSSIKAYFVDPVSGQPRTENILKVAGGVLGVVALFVAVRKVTN